MGDPIAISFGVDSLENVGILWDAARNKWEMHQQKWEISPAASQAGKFLHISG